MDVDVVAPSKPVEPDLMDIVEVDEDEMEMTFEKLETVTPLANAKKDYLTLLKTDRNDEIANRVKEKCIYK